MRAAGATVVTCPHAALAPGNHEGSLEHDGATRSFVVHVPPSFDNTSALPLVLAFHGATSTKEGQESLSQMDAKADAAENAGADLVEILIKDRPKADHRGSDMQEQIHLSEETEAAFNWLRSQCPLNSDLEKHLVAYARLLGMK